MGIVFSDTTDLITKALKKGGIVGVGRAASAAEIVDGVQTLNLLLDEISLLRSLITVRTSESFTLTYNKNPYNIGSLSTDFNTVRPIRIEQAFVRDTDGVTDYPLDVTMLEGEYARITLKHDISRPAQIFYKPDYPFGVITFDYYPDKAYTLFIKSWKPFAKITDPSDATQLSFPDGLESALCWNLAEYLLGENKRPADPLISMKARETLANVAAAYGEMPKAIEWDLPFAGNQSIDPRGLFGQ